jgi:hypothetical protein
MANIPNSSRYRTAGNKPSAKTGAANGTGSARNGHNAHDWPVNQTTGNNWLVGLVGLVAIGLLIAFPYHVLGVIGFGLLLTWFFGKK